VIAALALLGYAVLLLTAGPAALARARWPEGAPRLAIAAWFVLTGSAVASVATGVLALMVPTMRVSADLAGLLAACVMALRAQYAHPGGAALTGAGAVLALTVLARITWCTARALAQAARARRRHRLRLSLVAVPDPQLGAVIVRHDEPAAYCMPGHGSRIVLTTDAIGALGVAVSLPGDRLHGLPGRAAPRVPAAGRPDRGGGVGGYAEPRRHPDRLGHRRGDRPGPDPAGPGVLAAGPHHQAKDRAATSRRGITACRTPARGAAGFRA
jgi:hypothetical protein